MEIYRRRKKTLSLSIALYKKDCLHYAALAKKKSLLLFIILITFACKDSIQKNILSLLGRLIVAGSSHSSVNMHTMLTHMCKLSFYLSHFPFSWYESHTMTMTTTMTTAVRTFSEFDRNIGNEDKSLNHMMTYQEQRE